MFVCLSLEGTKMNATKQTALFQDLKQGQIVVYRRLILGEDRKYVVVSMDETFVYLCETNTHEIKKIDREYPVCNGWEAVA